MIKTNLKFIKIIEQLQKLKFIEILILQMF